MYEINFHIFVVAFILCVRAFHFVTERFSFL